MFEFFIALFGSLFYGGKFTSDKVQSRAAKQRFSKDEIVRKELLAKCEADAATQQEVANYLLSGAHYPDICDKYSDAFEAVFGDRWKNELRIPRGSRWKSNALSQPLSDAYWVYHLILADKGKMTRSAMYDGFPVSSVDNQNRDTQFVRQIENKLLKSGIEIKLVLEQTRKQAASHISGCRFKPEAFCNFPTRRLW